RLERNLGPPGHLREDPPLHRVLGAVVPRDLPPMDPGQCEHPYMLSGAVVVQADRLQPFLGEVAPRLLVDRWMRPTGERLRVHSDLLEHRDGRREMSRLTGVRAAAECELFEGET